MSDLARGSKSATTFRVNADSGQADKELARFQDRIDKLNAQVNRLNKQLQNPKQLNLRKSTREITRFQASAKSGFGALAAFNTYTATASGLLSGAFVFAVGNATINLVKLGAVAESTRERFLALSETISDGRKRYQEFADFADDRGLEFKGLVEAANQLRVVGFAGEDLDELIQQIGITAGSSVERVERITRALGQMRAFGRVALEELNQLTEAGIPIITAIAKELDVPEGKVRGLIELGKIDFQTVRNAFADLASESSVFFDASEAQSETLQASFSRLGNAIFMFSDEVNERTSPALKGFIEAGADVVTFFTTFEGSVIGLTALAFPPFLIALGTVSLLFFSLIRSTDPMVLAFRKINVQMAISTAGVGRLRKALILLHSAMRAAFTGPALAITAIASVAIPAIIYRMEKLREEAMRVEEALKSLAAADPGTITPDDTPELFNLAQKELITINSQLESATQVAEQYFQSWKRVKDEIEDAGEATKEQIRTLAFLNENVSLFSKGIEDLEKRKISIEVSLGLLPPTVSQDSDPFGIQIATNKLEADLLQRLEEAQGLLAKSVEFTPGQEEASLRSYISFITKLQKEVIDANIAGLLFNPKGSTITTLNTALDAATARLEALREVAKDTKTPLDDLNAILEKNSETLLKLEVSAEVGLVGEAEKAEKIITANQEALRDLIILYKTLSGEGVSEDVVNRLEEAIEDFQSRQPIGPQGLDNDLFAPLFEETTIQDFRERIAHVFTDAEKAYNKQFRGFLSNLSRIRGVGKEEGLVDLFPIEIEDLDKIMQDEIRQETYDAILKSQEDFIKESESNAEDFGNIDFTVSPSFNDDFEQESFRFIKISENQSQSFSDLNKNQLKAYIEYGNDIGVYASDIVDELKKTGDITEEEAFRLHEVIGEATDEIEKDAERSQEAINKGFTFRVSPQLYATANALLTTGEAFVSAGAAAENLFNIFKDGAPVFNEPRLGIIAFANALATLISIGEQPILAAQDAVITFSKVYDQFLNVLELSKEELEAKLDILPEDQAKEIRQLIVDFREVYSRVGTGFDADAFRLLPAKVQGILEDAFRQYRGIEPTLQEIFAKAREIVENENITLAERVRQTGRLIADELGEEAIQLGQSITNIINYIGNAGSSFDIFKEIIGGLGEVLGLGRERTISFIDGLDLLLRTGESTLILQERITETINLSTLKTILGFNTLINVGNNLDAAYQRVAVSGYRLNTSFDRGLFDLGEYSDGLGELNDTLNVTSLGLEEGAVAIGGLIAAGGSLAGVIAPGVGLLAESVGNVLDAAADYVAVNRVIQNLPTWFRQGDVNTFQLAIRELDNYTTATREAQEQLDAGFDVELPELTPLIKDAQNLLSSLSALQPFITSDKFDEFLANRDFPEIFPESGLNLGEQFLLGLNAVATGAELTTEKLELLKEVMSAIVPELLKNVTDSFSQDLQNSLQIARAFSSTLSLLAETITHNTRIQVEVMRQELSKLRDDRLTAEKDINEQLDRETDALKERLNTGLISLNEFYNRVDEARKEADAERAEATQEELKLLNKIQEAEYEAKVNAFNINKATRLADIAINAAATFATVLAQLGIFGPPVAGVLAALAAAQAVLVLSQQPPPKPDPITALQTGGVVNRPTKALIGEAGPEAVIPLDKYDFRKKGDNGGINITINNYGTVIEERNLAEKLYKVTKQAQRERRVPSRSR